jgi:hypothetical protein
MATTIAQFLADIIHDPERRGLLFTDIHGLLDTSDLTDAQKNAILSGDPLRLKHVIEYELNLPPDAQAIWILYIPPPPPPPQNS